MGWLMVWLDEAPLWVIGLALAIAQMAAEELAYLVRRTVALRWEPPEEGPGVGYLISAALALLGLLLAFTFSMAAAHHDLRSRHVVAEANAVSAAFLRYQLLDDPARAELSRQTLAYLDLRLQDGHGDPRRQEEVRARTEAARAQIWRTLRGVVRDPSGAVLAQPLLDATNAMFGEAAASRAAVETRVPGVILRTVIYYALACAVFMGYGLASGGRHFAASTALFLLVAMTITLIIDVDRPRPGVVRVDQAPLERVAAGLRAEAGSALGERPD